VLPWGHDPSIVDKNVDLVRDSFDLFNCLTDRMIVQQVKLNKNVHIRVYLLNLFYHWSDLVLSMTGEDDSLGAGMGQSYRYFSANATLTWTGDEDYEVA
jgi:hypothetical protein